jgi:hypothetical protein
MTRIEFGAFLCLLMCADLGPVGDKNREIIIAWADKQAQGLGFADWTTAYLEWEDQI